MRTRKEIHQEIIRLGGLVKLDQLSQEEMKKLYSLYCEDQLWIQANAPLHQYNAMFNANYNAKETVNQVFEKKYGKKIS